jgi:hypothetical protein
LTSFACHAAKIIPLSSEVSEPASIANKLNIDNVYRSLETKSHQYYAGFSIDSDRINHPVLIELDKISGRQNSWKFDEIISDIFIFNSTVSVVLENGENYSLIKGEWVRNSRVLEEMSVVVFSDARQRLISCTPSSLGKADTRQGGCESFNPNWKLSFSWHKVRPKVCGEFLYAVTWEQKHNQRLAINLKSGKVVHKQVFSGEDICTPFD